MKTKLRYYLYLNQNKTLLLRKQKYRANQGEIRIELNIKVPNEFFEPKEITQEISLEISKEAFKNIEPEVTLE